jgi:dihydroneopterin aldolase
MLNKKTDLMYLVIRKYVNYAKAYNRKFKEVKDKLLSSDHKLVEYAIGELLSVMKGDEKNNYWEISETYRKMISIKRFWKVDQQLFDVSKKCFTAVQQNRQILLKARKYLFKTPNQINGFRKLSNAMKFRWGGMF